MIKQITSRYLRALHGRVRGGKEQGGGVWGEQELGGREQGQGGKERGQGDKERGQGGREQQGRGELQEHGEQGRGGGHGECQCDRPQRQQYR